MTPIARRYFIKNGFDGSMTVLGIIVGSWIVRVTEPEIIVTAGLGACLAMGVSGAVSRCDLPNGKPKSCFPNILQRQDRVCRCEEGGGHL